MEESTRDIWRIPQIPVEDDGTDEIINGIALCHNRKKDILDFHETKNIKSVEYNSIDEMIESGWRISPVQPHN